jgi:hypothetical protein
MMGLRIINTYGQYKGAARGLQYLPRNGRCGGMDRKAHVDEMTPPH